MLPVEVEVINSVKVVATIWGISSLKLVVLPAVNSDSAKDVVHDVLLVRAAEGL